MYESRHYRPPYTEPKQPNRLMYPFFGLLAFCLFVTTSLSMRTTIPHRNESPSLRLDEPRAPKLSSDHVPYLPRFGNVEEKQYAGLVTVNAAEGNIFYWFFESRVNPLSRDTPLIVWLNGGPGASSMTGLLTEMGPYRMNADGTMSSHPHSWTNLGHMLFFDQPVGTGYTSAKNESGYVNSQLEMAEQLYIALTSFYDLHPEYAMNRVVIAGESYAGKYVPHIAHYIHEMNQKKSEKKTSINLWGVAIGNGEMKPLVQTMTVADYALSLGLIDKEQFDQHRQSLEKCASLVQEGKLVDAFGVCQRTEDEIYREAGNPFIYDIRQQGNAFTALTLTLSKYFNLPETREALNIPPNTLWTSIDGSSYGDDPTAPAIARHLLNDEMVDVSDEILETLMNKYHVLYYAGNMDGSSCNHLGMSRVVDQLKWNGAEEFHRATRHPWKVNGDSVGGLAKEGGNVAVVVITNSGHLVPTDQPEASLEMMRRFLTQRSFALP
ncbi:hypothetical protein H310_02239 [Aphanomyces invadans]|uniref:Carboxypeptidase n=1 Tax=Aphanomyces invadans TaxID=157072 RepID=A0A024UNP4_9STRA|nr:hypothetical protein H310_02239 [Aphanomyces invadans]ETW07810.1 hypothetical protein H310_02239 [Aphanomyces invadans]|eukprot:XP_008863903.1 hypothetical protein H310_02239 [Aphanomyces invadans]